MKQLILMLALAGSASTWALDVNGWNAVVARAKAQGQILEMADGTVLRYLQNLQPDDRTVTHTAKYFSAVGVDVEGEFQAYGTTLVAENWLKQEDGGWIVDQWIFQSDLDGNLIKEDHGQLTETATGRVLETKDFPNDGIADPAVIKVWDALVAEWIQGQKVKVGASLPAPN